MRGTGVVALRVDEPLTTMQLAWVGTSRAFGIDANGEWSELTVANATTPTSIRTMALGVTDVARLHVAEANLDLSQYQRILLCSDAMIPLIGANKVADILKEREWSAQEMVDAIAFESLESDVEDCFSLIVLKIS